MEIDFAGTHYINGDYVATGMKNAFNGKTSFWISKKGYALAFYCFSASTEQEVQDLFARGGWDCMIDLFENYVAKLRAIRGEPEHEK